MNGRHAPDTWEQGNRYELDVIIFPFDSAVCRPEKTLKSTLLVICLAFGAVSAQNAQRPTVDPWAPVRFLEGKWSGTAEGEPGVGPVQRSYEFVLGHRFLHERNTSTYAPKQAGESGEVHEHWSLLSFDKRRNRIVLRQFHQEGFVNQYALDVEHSTPQKLIFVSESFENLDPRWRARETYDVISKDEFTETFEIAPPGEDFGVYSKNSFKRVAAQ